jgi:outer membrane receptor for ferrienterochelin and colicin
LVVFLLFLFQPSFEYNTLSEAKIMDKRIIITSILCSFFVLVSFAQNGTISGRVFNATTNKPLDFQTVLIQGTTIGTSSDSAGMFVFNNVSPGFYKLTTSSLGYETAVSPEIHVQGNRIVYVDIPVYEKTQDLKEIVVSSGALSLKKLDAPLSLQTIGVQDLEKTAGVNRDVSKAVQTLPGVLPTTQERNDLIVRGGGPSENVFFLDEVEIPIINHFATQGSSGGAVSLLNADFVREANFYTGAFPANRGNALSSVLDIKQRDGDKDHLHASFTVGSSDAGVTVDGPIGSNTTFLASVRQSYLQFLFKFIGLPFLPTYNDYQFKIRTRLGPNDELTLVGIGAIDDMTLNTSLKDPTESQRYILSYLPIYEQWNYAVGVVYKHYSDNHFDTWVLSRNMLRNRNYKYQDNDASQGKIQDYRSDEAENKLRFERSFQRLPFRLMVGAGVKYAHYTNETSRMLLSGEDAVSQNYHSDLDLLAYQFFTQASDSYLDGRLRLSLGISLTGNDYQQSMRNPLNQFSPRLSASYTLNDAWILNASAGRYVLSPSYTTLGFRNDAGELVNRNEEVRYTGSNQTAVGLEFNPNKEAKFTLETFYKGYDHYAISVADGVSMASKGTEYGQVGDEAIVSNGKGRAYGAEFLFKLRDNKRVNVSTSYTLFWSEFTDAAGSYRPSAWDVRHVFNLLGSYKFGNNLTLGMRWRYVGGEPYTPIDESLSSRKDIWNIRNQPYLDYSRYNSSRLKGSHILDLRLDKEIYFDKWMLNLYLDIQNAYNYQVEGVPIYTNLDTNGQPVTNSSDPTRYVLRKIDATGGNVLPAIGFMIKY